MNDKHLRLVAAFEQAGAFLNVFSAFLFSYHKDLCNAGFRPEESLALVKDMQRIMFGNAFKELGPDVDDMEE